MKRSPVGPQAVSRPACVPLAGLLALAAGCSHATAAGAEAGMTPSPEGEAPLEDAATTADSPGAEPAGDAPMPEGTDAAMPSDTEAGGRCPPSWTPTPSCGGGGTSAGSPPDFGPHVLVLDPSVGMTTIQSQISAVNAHMEGDQFDDNGYAYLFKPGQYKLDVKVGFYTHVVGLGHTPDDVTISGAVRAKADWFGGNATLNFWRTVENVAVVPDPSIDGGTNVWAVSQGTAFRRGHVKGSMRLDDGGWASGGFVADTVIDGQMSSGTQQQFLTRNDDLGNWQGSNWNMVFVGDLHAPAPTWPHPPMTVVASTPVVREKPFLFVDASGGYFVMRPDLKTGSNGASWASGDPPGAAIAIDRFYVAKAGTDTAATMNAALAQGKHLLLTPGDYALDAPLEVNLPDTIVLGIGLPVLTPKGANALVTVGDVDGVSLAGFLVEAGPTTTPTLLQVGTPGVSTSHRGDPTVLFDVHCRIGGNIAGTAASCFTIDSDDVILDNVWLWRADHGAGANWNTNKSDSGIIVNGDDVTAYGLFVEHHQKYQTVWNGNGGSVYFYQSELPYDPPSQSAWMATPGEAGYPSYKVAATVTSHRGAGIGVYSFFQNDVHAATAVETPSSPGVVMNHLMTFSSGSGGINGILNGAGGSASGSATAYSSQ